MKRIDSGPGYRSVSVSPVRMVIDDLIALERQLPDGERFTVRTLGYEFDTLTELSDHARGRTLSTLDLIADSVSIAIRSHGCEVAGDAKPVSFMVTYLSQYVPIWSRSLRKPYRLMLRILLVAVGMVGALSITPYLSPNRLWFAFAFLAAALLGLSPALADRRVLGGSRIVVETALAHRSFWEKHGDDIVKSGVSALVGALIGFIVGRFG